MNVMISRSQHFCSSGRVQVLKDLLLKHESN